MSAVSTGVDASVPDGTTDYVPMRKGAAFDPKKPHISETPMTWSNWWKHVNWINTYFIAILPLMGFIATYWVPLKLNTAIFSLVYYFHTGLGITAGEFLFQDVHPPLMGFPRTFQY